ncbi:MAG TPA: hypothetical protein VJQ83_12340, partial [Tepidiformaceae bacterium]|nr:hypothetical protein [Tepidiformaceae bacterium]
TNTGAVDKAWRPAPGPDNSVVRSIALSGDKVFLAGSFTTVGTGQDNGRASGLAAVSATGTGALQSWNPNPTPVNSVEALLANADKIYVAGGFENIGATPSPRVGLAAINISDGEETEWNPELRVGSGPGRARAIALGKDALYVSGAFDHVGGAAHDRLAAVSLSGTGAPTGFTATFTANTDVTTLAVAADALYLGGNFTTVNSDTRNRLAAVDLGSGAVQSWNPGADSVVQAITVSGDTVYVAGDFENIASKARKYLAAIDKSGKLVESWDPRPSGATKAIAADDDTVYVSGDNVVTYGAEPYPRLASFKGDGRSLTTWTAAVSGGEVLALAVSGTDVYVAGSFNKVGTEDRNGVAVLNDAAAVSSWNAGLSPGASVHALALSSDTVYLGGLFTRSAGNRSNIVALKTSDASIPGSWVLMASVSGGGNGLVEALALDGSTLYVGGDFGMIGPARGRLAALNAGTGAANDWDPNAGGGAVHALSVVGNVVFVGGEFEELAGDAHAALGAINKSTGAVTAQWPPAVASDPHVRAIFAGNEALYVGGRFSTVGTGNGNKHERVVVFDTKASPYATLAGAPDIQGTGVNAILWDNGKLYLGGNFISASGATCINFCVTAFSPPPP